MNLRRESGVVKAFLFLLVFFLGLKGWILFSLVSRPEGASCSAEAVAAPKATRVKPVPIDDEACGERMAGLIEKIQQEDERLRERSRRLEEREGRIQILRQELDTRIASMKTLLAAIEKIRREMIEEENERQLRLVKIYDAMEPENAARRLEQMDEALASWLLLRINVRKAGQILGTMNPEKAGRITTRLKGTDPRSARQIQEALAKSRKAVGKAKPAKVTARSRARRSTKKGASQRLLQVASFREEARARRVVKALKKKGYPCFSRSLPGAGSRGPFHRVFVGPYSSPRKVSEVKASLERQGYRGILVRSGSVAAPGA